MQLEKVGENYSVEELSLVEMRSNNGGGLIDLVVKYVEQGLTYCYNMGLSEALRYRKQLK